MLMYQVTFGSSSHEAMASLGRALGLAVAGIDDDPAWESASGRRYWEASLMPIL
jgi:hypothetical protein